MKPNVIVLLYFFITCFFSCTTNNEANSNEKFTNRVYLVDMLNELFKEMNNSNFTYMKGTNCLDISPIIGKYFFRPNDILKGIDTNVMRVYFGRLDFYSNYVKEKGKYLKVYWDDDILKHDLFDWMLDNKQCESTLLLTYISGEGKLRRFNACFKNKKIYSILPFGDSSGNVVWSRNLKSTVTENGILLVPSEIDSVME